MTSLVHKNSSSTLANYSYTYTIDGNMSRRVENGNTTNYTYDVSNRLLKESATRNGTVTNMTYAYDTAGNRSKLTVTGGDNYVTIYTYDKNNRLLRESKVNSSSSYADLTIYSYDNNGNQTRKDKSKNNLNDKPATGFYSESEIGNTGYGYEKFTYNGLNQLVKFEDEKSNTTEYAYMSNGLRLSKSVNGSKTNFIWDESQIMMTVSSDETVSYAKAPGYMRRGTSKELVGTNRNDTFYLFNGHGDVTALTDKTGTLTKTYEYDAFGNEINPSTNDTNPFRYCGEYYDEETGSIYLRARYYSPITGRFTAEDPIKDGLNWYAYCGGNPVMFWDPSGMFGENTVLEKGKNNNATDVIKVQQVLSKKNLLDARYTYGSYDEYTMQAVNLYKEQNNLENTGDCYGKVGKTTWEHMGLECDSIYEISHSFNDGSGISSDGLFASLAGPNLDNGINLITAKAGLTQINNDKNYYELNMELCTANANVGISTGYIGYDISGSLVSGSAGIKIPLPFTESKLIITGTGYIGGVGIATNFNADEMKITVKAIALVGSGVTIGVGK